MLKVNPPPSLADAMAKVKASAGRELRADTVVRALGDDGDLLTSWLHDTGYTSLVIESAMAEHAKVTGADVTLSSGAITTWRKRNGIA